MCTEEEVTKVEPGLQPKSSTLNGIPSRHLTRRDRRCFPGICEHDVDAVITGLIVQAVTECRQQEDPVVTEELLPLIRQRRLKMDPSLLLKAVLQDGDAVLIVLLEE